MGMSSSQARLLNLTARMHQIEYKAAKLEAMKLQMANESTRVYEDYLTAIDATKIQYKVLNTDGSLNYVDATYNNLIAAGYTIKLDGENKEVVDDATAANFVTAAGNKEYFKALQTGRVTTTNQTVGGVVEIYTLDQLKQVNGNSKYRLMVDIDAKNEDFQLSLDGGSFDGNGHTICNLSKSLFSTVNNSDISNLNISGNSTSKALLAVYAQNSTIQNVSASGTVNNPNDSTVGGLIASGNNLTLEQCSANVNISGKAYTGGLVGTLYSSTVNNCSATGTINASYTVGGLIGHADGLTVSNSTTSTNITLTTSDTSGSVYLHAAGFIGNLINNSIVTNCSSSGNITNNNTYAVGGLAGFVGQAYWDVTIENCNSSTDVVNNVASTRNLANYIGGFAGDLNEGITTISNCNSTGSVTENDTNGINFVGAFAGASAANGTSVSGHTYIDNCYTSETGYNFIYRNTDTTITNTQTSAVSNTISVTPPSITINQTVSNTDADAAGSLFDRMTANGYTTMTPDDPRLKYGDDSTWLTNMINAGMAYIYKTDADTSELYQVSVSTDTNLQEVSDDTLLRKAEAQYEADMKRIDLKDRKYDTDLAALDTERNAIKQEMETIKTVAKENVERTFKLFS